ncbi:peptidoglycan recognition protein family protein [Streptomyces sp. NBC_00582]|uniref:peptidoglycan recognition protein family protein n=1 Tax=Streptomyces sp. NBC_00582 TaxID=2975783 RepID=UPI002E82195C|nr:N-acetylmuramoyl-L-alanine amidase [Streptomyces sp. NBC_00582]WUB64162.1 N-acetylmuramoyl-L-alanine amidase [Streptomyces sp. NBC_00582]
MSKIVPMRGLLATSIGVTCAAALALPLTSPATAAPVRPAPTAEAGAAHTESTESAETTETTEATRTTEAAETAEPATESADTRAAVTPSSLPGTTRSLPLTPLTRDRTLGPADQGLRRRNVHRFSLLGVVWNDPDAELHGRVQVRTHPVGGDAWSGWQDVETHNADHGADPGTPERTSGHVRGATAPLWVGDSDGVEVRVHPDTRSRTEETGRGVRTLSAAAPLPAGLHLELVDPGAPAAAPVHVPVAPRSRALPHPAPPALSPAERAASAANATLAPLGATKITALNREQTKKQAAKQQRRANPYIGPRPSIVTRRGWGADESMRETGFRYTTTVKAAFVHHTATGNNYTCAQAPSVIRGIYRYHVKSMGWRDIGYNFLVDKCGTIYEGRAGGVAKAVMGAHTLGFNTNSMGVAVLGTFTSAKPNSATVTAIARLTAWKLGLFGADPRGKTYLKSGGGNLYAKGKNVRLNVISGHRDGFATECPGKQLYGKLGTARSTAATYQGR